MLEFLRSLFGGSSEADRSGQPSVDPENLPQEWRRVSSGLEQFLSGFEDQGRCQLLDIGAGSSSTVNYLGLKEHRVEISDVLHALEHICGSSGQCGSDEFQEFLREACDFRVVDYDGAMVWEALQFMSPVIREEVVKRLHRTLRPGSYLFAMFYAGDWGATVPTPMVHHIMNHRELVSVPRKVKLKPYPISIREIDQLFTDFSGVKYVLSKGSLREVIVRR